MCINIMRRREIKVSTLRASLLSSPTEMGFTRDVVETDFFNLQETKSNTSSSKRESPLSPEEKEMSSKRAKLDLDDALSLSLALPDIESSNNNNNTKTMCCSGLTGAASLSHSSPRPSSYNIGCFSVGRNANDQIWRGGYHGSVHSSFRPIGNHGLVALNNYTSPAVTAGGTVTLMQEAGNHANDSYNNNNKYNNESVRYKADSFDTLSFFQSALPWWPRLAGYSGDSKRTESQDGEKLSTPRRILRQIVSESIPVMAQIFQRVAQDTLESTKDYLSNLIAIPPDHKEREELVGLQNQLERRCDLTKEALSKCQKDQLDILVATKMGHGSFISGSVRLPTIELIEIFLFMRCRNVKCKSILPVDDCDCTLCSGSKGFCSLCTCQVCMNFDGASNTCAWVGCDVCSHWCHASCGIKKGLIMPAAPSLKGQHSGSRFHCIACNHASEMFGFVKDVFVCCAKDWGMETVIKELDCVSKIFQGSEDARERELHTKAKGLLSKLERKMISASDACNIIIQFFNCVDDGMTSGFPASGVSAKELLPTEPTIYGIVSSSVNQSDLKATCVDDLENKSEFQFWKSSNKDGLENIVQMKEAEASMFQRKADNARRVAQAYRQLMIQARATEKLNKEKHADKLTKLSMQETKGKPRKQLEGVKVLESSHCDHHNTS